MSRIEQAFAGLAPMEAKLVEALPEDEGWQYEPKWDGFRALLMRDGTEVAIKSKSGKPLDRYFPEIADLMRSLSAPRFILDGELVLPQGGALSFDALQARLHPAPSRIARLSRETPAQVMLFDCLWWEEDDLLGLPLRERRARLEDSHAPDQREDWRLSTFSLFAADARAWLAASGGALDGVVAKRLDEPYRPGERDMLKVKQHRTADCVVGGFREVEGSGAVASLLLGLYDDAGLLNHVGFTSGLSAGQREALRAELEPLIGGPGFTGKAPGGPSRWNNGKESPWVPLRPERVVEVLYDQVTGDRFRHGTRLLRWRRDKAPDQCRYDQLIRELKPVELEGVVGKRRD